MKNKLFPAQLVAGIMILALLFAFLPSMRTPQPALAAGGPAVFINEIHYDNTGTDTGEAVEIAGPAGTDLFGWSLVLYNGNGGAPYATTPLSGSIPDLGSGYGVVVYPEVGLQNGSPDGLALIDPDGNVIQFLSYEGEFTAVGGPADGMTSTDIDVSEPYYTPVGESLQLTGTGTTYSDFSWAGPGANTFGAINNGQFFIPLTFHPVVVNCGSGLTTFQRNSESTDVSASDVDGTVTSLAISDISPVPEAGSITLSDFAPADSIGGTATATLNADASLLPGTYIVTLSASNDEVPPQTGSCKLAVVVNEVLTIGEVQGAVGNNDDGATFASPYAGQTVVIQGVIYENILSGSSSHAFFIQNTTATADGDPNSSDGIYVYIGYYSTLRKEGGGYYTPKVGDEVVLRGPVTEYYNLTELSNPYLLSVVNTGLDINTEVPAFDANPPANLADANRYWERREGMRGEIPADSIVLNGRNVFASSFDAEVWVARPDSTIAQRTDPYTDRAFRDAHPLDDNYDPTSWDGNGYRILMGSLGIKAAENDNTAMINPARTFDTVVNAVTGGLYYGYSKYTIQPETQVDFAEGVDPALNAPPQVFSRTEDYSIVDYNLENLYDYRNNPNSGCDFSGDSGCSNVGTPFLSSITPSFDYVPASDAAYQTRLNDIALQIINDLHSPDILMVQEVENQDICSVADGALACDLTTGNPDGKPDVLQELALKVAALGGPAYDAAYDPDSSDLRGIAPAFLYRTDKVQLLPAAGDPILGTSPAIPGYTAVPYDSDVSNPKTLNAELPSGVSACETEWVFPRAPDIGLFRIWRDGVGSSVFTDVYVIDNHFKSGPDSCVAHRTEQAKYNAAIVSYLQSTKPDARIVLGGDLNVYPRPDDPFAPIGQPSSSDQLGSLYDPALGLTNLWEVLLSQVPEAAYSYVYVGQAQTLDQVFANQPMRSDLQQFRSAHINSDFPADYPGDVARGTSDHDPQAATFSNLPTIDRLEALVNYYTDNGMITGNNTTKNLLDRLEKARRFQENGQQDAYMDQLQAFIDQIYDFTPQFITQEAANALQQETELLMTLP